MTFLAQKVLFEKVIYWPCPCDVFIIIFTKKNIKIGKQDPQLSGEK
jgi:hypothetical protein